MNNEWTVAINSKISYRDDCSAKPPFMSLTLQNSTPFTKGTDDNSSKSKSILNLNRFFFIRINDMFSARHALTEEVKLSDSWTLSLRGAVTAVHSAVTAVKAASLLGTHHAKFKSPPFPPTEKWLSWRKGNAIIWLDTAAAGKKRHARYLHITGWEQFKTSIIRTASRRTEVGISTMRGNIQLSFSWHVMKRRNTKKHVITLGKVCYNTLLLVFIVTT